MIFFEGQVKIIIGSDGVFIYCYNDVVQYNIIMIVEYCFFQAGGFGWVVFYYIKYYSIFYIV